jgi:hypothetical protein
LDSFVFDFDEDLVETIIKAPVDLARVEGQQ